MNFVETIRAAGAACAEGTLPVLLEPEDALSCVILKAASGEPLVETESCLCRIQPERVVKAVCAIAENTGAKRTVIAVREDDEKAMRALQKAIQDTKAPAEIFKMEAIYPFDDELVLTYLITGKSVPERGTPHDAHCAVITASEALDILNALEETPVTERYLTVLGAIQKPLLLKAPIGARLSACIKAAGAIGDAALIVGGPMRGRVLTTPSAIEAAVVTRRTETLIVLPKDHPLIKKARLPMDTAMKRARSACEQCRLCTEFCPRYGLGQNMRPNLIMRNLRREKELSETKEYREAFGDAVNCCFCGLCDVVCPMGLQPRRINAYCLGGLKKRGYKVPRQMEPVPREKAGGLDTKRLENRLGLSEYGGFHDFTYRELTAGEVSISFLQRAHRPAQPLKHMGDVVSKGELIALDGFCAGIHASIGGTIIKISANGAVIKA